LDLQDFGKDANTPTFPDFLFASFQLLDIAIAQQQKLPSQLVGAILRVCGYKN